MNAINYEHRKRILSFGFGLALLGGQLCAQAQQTNAVCTPPAVSVNSLSSNTFVINVTGGNSGLWYVHSTDDLNATMSSWTFAGTVNGGGSTTFTDNGINGVMHRFYKLSRTNAECCTPAIGFIRRDVQPGTTNYPGANALIADQLYATANTLDGVFNPMAGGAYLPANAKIMKWNPATSQFTTYTWSGSSWGGSGSVTFAPGEGGFLVNPLTNTVRVSFAGLVQDGSHNLPLPANQYQIISSTVPRSGALQSTMQYSPKEGDHILFWNGGGYDYYFYGEGAWDPSQPVIGVGQAFFHGNWDGNTNLWQTSFTGCPWTNLNL